MFFLGFKLIRWLLWLVCTVVFVTVVWVELYRFIDPPFSNLMIKRHFIQDGPSWKYEWVDSEEMGKNIKFAVLASEDQRFFLHWGFDFSMMKTAFFHNLKGRKIRGASTITQQLAKNLFLWEERSYTRKVLEVWFTAWIEILWSKQRILEVYLNIIEMGKGVYGVEAASQKYFGKPVNKLSRAEAASLAVILPAPLRLKPNQLSSRMLVKRDWVVRQMPKIPTE